MKEVDKIKGMLAELPISDIKIGFKLLGERNFTELQYLVDSAIIRVKTNVISESPKPDNLRVNVGQLEILSSKISYYRDQLIEDIVQIEDEVIEEDDLYSIEEENEF